MDFKKALNELLTKHREFVPEDVDCLAFATGDTGIVDDQQAWTNLLFYWYNRLDDPETADKAIEALNQIEEIAIGPEHRKYELMFNKYVAFGGPCPKGPGIIVQGDWEQSWASLSSYWRNLLNDTMAKHNYEDHETITGAINLMTDIESEFQTEGPF